MFARFPQLLRILSALFWSVPIAIVAYKLATAAGKFAEWLPLPISIFALWTNLYSKFFQGPRLVAVANQITILGLTLQNQVPLVNELAVIDLLSAEPSDSIRSTWMTNPQVKALATARNREGLTAFFSRQAALSTRYVPPDALIANLLDDVRATPSFFIPLDIANIGGSIGQVASVFAVFELEHSKPPRQWAFAAYMEVDPKIVSDLSKQKNDMSKFSGTFPGCTVEPGKSVRCNLHFVAQRADAIATVESASNLLAGTYLVRLMGFDSFGRRSFMSQPIRYPLQGETRLCAFQGSDWAYFPSIEQNVRQATARRRWFNR